MRKLYIFLIAISLSALAFGQSAGDIIITEILQNPLSPIADGDAEFFEVYNTTASDIDINGWTIRDNGTNNHVIGSSLIVSAGGYKILGRSTDMAINGGVAVDYAYGADVALGNSSDALILETATGTQIDSVRWDNGATFPDPNGKTMNLDIMHYNYNDNDLGANWCEASTPMGATQFGTPSAGNISCAPPCDLMIGADNATCDAVTLGVDAYTATVAFTVGGTETYTITSSSGGTVGGDDPTVMATGTISVTGLTEGMNDTINISGGSCNFEIIIRSPVCVPATCAAVGSIIITEVMQNPLSPVNDSEAEWFEVYNTTSSAIDLQGWTILDDNHTLSEEGFVIPNSLVIMPGGFLVFANNADSLLNGGFHPDYIYNGRITTLGNGTDGLKITCSGTIIDSVIWDNGVTFPDPDGSSMNLGAAHFNATDNDDGSNWCESTTAFGPTQFATPQAGNRFCSTPGCDLTLGAMTAVCDARTAGVDTYTFTVAFTDGNTSTYIITPNAGTVSGDNPSSMAAGTISITGVPEGTNIAVSITDTTIGGTCIFDPAMASPLCLGATCGAVGDIIFTEIMQNPSVVQDSMGEWFEIYNTTAADIDLEGWDIIDDNHSLADEGFTIATSLIIPAGGYLVFTCKPDSLTNGGVNPDYTYVYGRDLTLGNGTDGLTIVCAGTIIDSVIWDNGATFPDPSGESMSLQTDKYNDTDNDDGANWSPATETYGAGDKGTPGTAGPSTSIGADEIAGFSIYPNPIVDGKIVLETLNSTQKEVILFDILGNKLYQNTISGSHNEINFGRLDAGIYVIKVIEGASIATRKLVVR